MTSLIEYPLAAAIIAREMPVLPWSVHGSSCQLANTLVFHSSDHPPGRTILHRAARVVPFQLGQQSDPGVRVEMLQLHHRGIADGRHQAEIVVRQTVKLFTGSTLDKAMQ